VCVDVNLLTSNSTADNTTSVFKTGALANLWNCGENSEFSQLETLVNEAIGVAANTTCEVRGEICFDPATGKGDPNWVCSQNPACGRDTLQVVTDAQHMTIIDNGQNRTLSECAVSCTNAEYKNTSQLLVMVVGEYENYTSIYESTVLPLISCQFASNVLEGFKGSLCDTLMYVSPLLPLFFLPPLFFLFSSLSCTL
jgi:hypothetical protein